jgi:tight adherence protein B
MSLAWIGLLAFLSAALLVWGIAYVITEIFLRYHSTVNDRLNEISGSRNASAIASPLFRDGLELSLPEAESSRSLSNRLNLLLQGAASQLSLRNLVKISVGTGLVWAVAAALVSGRWWTAPPSLICGMLAPLLWLSFQKRRRIRLLREQLPETFDVMSRAVRAGQTIPAAFQTIADDFDPPISHEFRCCYEEQNLGIPFETALRNLAQRTGIIELQILVVALLVHGRCGGNLVELLQTLSTMVRKRQMMEGKIKSLTSEGRMQAIVLMVLPVAAP